MVLSRFTSIALLIFPLISFAFTGALVDTANIETNAIAIADGGITLSPFGQIVKSLMSDDLYNRLFAVSFTSNAHLLQTIRMANKAMEAVFDAKLDDAIAQKLIDEGERLGTDRVTHDLLFHVYTNALAQTFIDEGILNDLNLKDVAQKYVDELRKAAMALKHESEDYDFPELIKASTELLKSVGLTSQEALNQFAQELLNVLDQYK